MSTGTKLHSNTVTGFVMKVCISNTSGNFFGIRKQFLSLQSSFTQSTECAELFTVYIKSEIDPTKKFTPAPSAPSLFRMGAVVFA
jgi:hypothetical protein